MEIPEPLHFDHLKLRHLKLLDLLHETKSLRRAAELLFVTQPAVTNMLKELEKMFGGVLVDRSHNGVQLTAAGIEVRTRLRIALNEIRAARDAVYSAQHHHILRVGALATAMVGIVPMAVRHLHSTGNMPRMTIAEGLVAGLLQSLAQGELDCVIARMSGSAHETFTDFDYEIVGRETLHVVCAREHALVTRPEVCLKDMLSYPWILPNAGAATRQLFLDALLEAGLEPPEPTVESMSFHSNIALVAATDMLAVAPRTPARQYERLGVIHMLPVPLKYPSGSIVFICRKASSAVPALVAFREALRAVSRQTFEDNGAGPMGAGAMQ